MAATQHFSLPGRFTALDGWRGICAVLVALYHFHSTSHFEHIALVRHAYLLVDFFFVLSGFVLTYAYWERLHTARDGGEMMWRRLGRLWPLHVALLLAFIGLELSEPVIAAVLGIQRSAGSAFDAGSSALLSAIPTNLLLLHGMGIHDRLTWNIPSWSISTELWSYLVFAVVAVALRRFSVVVAIALGCFGVAVLAAFSPRMLAADFDFGFFRCIYGFFTGHLVFRLVKTRSIPLPAPTLTEIGVVAGLVVFVSTAAGTRLEFAAPLVFAVAVLVFAKEQGAISSVLKAPPMNALGLLSYSIYMVHGFVIAVVHRALTVLEHLSDRQLSVTLTYHGELVKYVSFGDAYTMDIAALVYIAVVVGLAALAWRYVEMPCQRLFNGADVGVPRPVDPATGHAVAPAGINVQRSV